MKQGGAWQAVWSPDGKQIVYQHGESFAKYPMKIYSLETGKEQDTGSNGYPFDWSGDGRFILYGEEFIHKPRAFAWRNKAYNARSEDMKNIKQDPIVDPLRSDPRFQDLLRRMNFPP